MKNQSAIKRLLLSSGVYCLLFFLYAGSARSQEIKAFVSEDRDQAGKEEGIPKEELSPETFTTVPPIQVPEHPDLRRRAVYPQTIVSDRNVMPPVPVPGNIQLYPFTLNMPMEGCDMLRFREISFVCRNIYHDGAMRGSSGRYAIRMAQWYLEQDFRLGVGLARESELLVSFPLYHFSGECSFTQDGVEMIGLGPSSRNFWGGAVVGLRKKLLCSAEDGLFSAVSGCFQFPEGNQRARGGTASGNWAVNGIIEKYAGSLRLTLNAGLIEAGSLRLMNDQVLRQEAAVFAALALSRNFFPTLAWDVQIHASRSALRYTGIAALEEWTVYASLGLRGQLSGKEFSLAMVGGDSDFPRLGLVGDLQIRW